MYKNTSIATAESIIGYKGHTRWNGWFDDECHLISTRKNEEREKVLQRQIRNAEGAEKEYQKRHLEEVSRNNLRRVCKLKNNMRIYTTTSQKF